MDDGWMVTTSSVTFKKALFDINSFKKRRGKQKDPFTATNHSKEQIQQQKITDKHPIDPLEASMHLVSRLIQAIKFK